VLLGSELPDGHTIPPAAVEAAGCRVRLTPARLTARGATALTLLAADTFLVIERVD
jgi:hypothetical protein